MKKSLKITTLLLSALFVLNSCNSTKQPDSVADEYLDGTVQTNNSDSKSEQKSKENKEGFSLKNFWGSHKFIDLDETTLYTQTITSNLQQQNAVITYFDKEKVAGFGSQYLMAYYYVSLTPEGRKTLATAYDLYIHDFDNKKLDRKDKKSIKQYGSCEVRLDWGTIKSSTPNYGIGKAYFGYKFKNNSPYFCITIYPIDNEKAKEDRDAYPLQSMLLTYCFTKAQGASLKQFLSDEYLEPYINPKLDTINVSNPDVY